MRLWRVCTVLCGCVRADLQARKREWKKGSLSDEECEREECERRSERGSVREEVK